MKDIDNILALINEELDWCHENFDTNNALYCNGFIAGLKQAIHLIKIAKIIMETREKSNHV